MPFALLLMETSAKLQRGFQKEVFKTVTSWGCSSPSKSSSCAAPDPPSSSAGSGRGCRPLAGA